MKKNWISIFFLLTGLLLCAALFLGVLAVGPASPGANEILSPAPTLLRKDGSLNDTCLRELSAWFADRSFLRQERITGYAGLQAGLFHASTAESVILSRDGWLYFGSTLPDYTGTDSMTERELYSAANNLALMRDYAQSRNAKFCFVCAPNKNSLYPANMPSYGAVNPCRDAQKLAKLLQKKNVPFADLETAFSAEPECLYFAHDSHWNSKGAALAADVIQSVLGRASGYYQDAFSNTEPHSGDLYEMLYPAGKDPERNPVYGGSLQYTFGEKSGTRPDSITIRTQSQGQGSLLMFRDSFGNLLYPYFADSFENAVFSRATVYDLTRLETIPADTLVVELVERNMNYLIQNVPVMPAQTVSLDLPIFSDTCVLTEGSSSSVPGLRLWIGNAENADPDSPVYLLCDAGNYACFLTEGNGFAAYVPETASARGAAWFVNGVLTAFAAG